MTATVTTGQGAGTPGIGKTGGGRMTGGGGVRGTLARVPGRIRRGGLPYLLLLPAILLELLIHLIPMIIGIVMSFRRLTQFFISNWGAAPWTGLDNYSVAVDINAPIGKALLHSFFVTCVFTFFAVGLAWLFGIAAAVMLQENFRGRGFLRAMFLVPYALPVYAAVITWAFMFQRDNGLINHVLHDQLGLTGQPSFWLIGDNSIYTLIIVSVWKGWPFAFLIVMAGLQNIPRELYEAAS
ncbi:MAG TPA: sugar ABC transporter permease, partial [Thermopolyspora sp.]